jgi:hypothetical protein
MADGIKLTSELDPEAKGCGSACLEQFLLIILNGRYSHLKQETRTEPYV